MPKISFLLYKSVLSIYDLSPSKRREVGFKISSVAAKGRNGERLQKTFDSILREAEPKLLYATMDRGPSNRRTAVERWLRRRKKKKVLTSTEVWRISFQSSDPFLDIEKDFYFFFECAAKRTSKRVADSIQKANKAAKNTVRMEAHFTLNEGSINDRVQRAVRREVSKLSPVSLPVKTPQAPRKTYKSRENKGSSSPNPSKRRDLSRNGNQRKLSASKNSVQGRRSRWRNNLSSEKRR